MPGADDIRDATAVDPGWMTEVLHAAGVGRTRSVLDLSARSIGTGQVGENVRYELRWSPGDEPVPPSVVAKFPSLSEVSRATAVQVDTYRREIGFYRDIRPMVTVRTPEILHLGWDPRTHDFVLVMEDLRGSEQGDQIAGCTVDRAVAAIDAIVGLHAPTWGRVDELRHLDWLGFPSEDRTGEFRGLFELTWPGFVDRFADRLDDEQRAIGQTLVDRFADLAGLTAAWAGAHGGWCITHADYRLDNILFGVTHGAPPVTVVDWQTATVGIGPADIAYFLGAGLLPADRRHHERELVDRYAAAVRAAGIDVDDDAMWEGYVLGTAGGYLMAILASQVVERTERGDEMFLAMATRHAAQIHDTGLLGLL